MPPVRSPNFVRVGESDADGPERLVQLLEIYKTALDELRAMRRPTLAGLIATLESLNASASREQRYLKAAEHARRRLAE
jgi:hypothetical protein